MISQDSCYIENHSFYLRSNLCCLELVMLLVPWLIPRSLDLMLRRLIKLWLRHRTSEASISIKKCHFASFENKITVFIFVLNDCEIIKTTLKKIRSVLFSVAYKVLLVYKK